jgi:predicted dehydrogenase
MDVGIYCLNACRYLTGEEPEKLQGYSSVIDNDGRFDTVEENLSFTMRFPSGVLASVSTTYGAPMNSFFRVHGSRGILEADPAFNYDGLHLKARIAREAPIDEPNTEKDPAQFVREADHFARCVFDNKEPKSNGEEGLRDMGYIAEIYRSCGLKLGS